MFIACGGTVEIWKSYPVMLPSRQGSVSGHPYLCCIPPPTLSLPFRISDPYIQGMVSVMLAGGYKYGSRQAGSRRVILLETLNQQPA